MNNGNWLGFSLTSQELPSSHESTQNPQNHSQQGSSVPSLDFNSDVNNFSCGALKYSSIKSQDDWKLMKDSCSRLDMNQQERPILENFLGVFNDTHHHHHHHHQEYNKLEDTNACNSIYMSPRINYQSMHQENNEATDYHATNISNINEDSISINGLNNGNNILGLSMIKNWLSNDHQSKALSNDAQKLSLSVSNVKPTSPSTNGHALESCTSGTSKLEQCGKNTTNAADHSSSQSTGGAIESVTRKSVETFGQRTSIYRGVTRHRWTGRYEAHLWDNSCRREGQTRKGRQVYLGGYDKEEKAARAYDLAALKYWGTSTTTNFPISNYEKELDDMKHMTRQEFIAAIRRKSSGFSRGASIYRGVTRHHQHGRWQARIGRVAGNKDLYLGTFTTQEEAAEAYDIAAIKFRGPSAVTNFEINRYDVKSILESSTLPIGGASKRLREAEAAEISQRADKISSFGLHLTNEAHKNYYNNHSYQQSQPFNIYPSYHNNAHQAQKIWCKPEHDSEYINGLSSMGYQLQLGSVITQDSFLQPPSVMDNLTGLNGNAANGCNNSFVEPMMGSSVILHDGVLLGNNNENDIYQQARKLYHQQMENQYEHGMDFNNWIPTAVPTTNAARVNNTATGWNDM